MDNGDGYQLLLSNSLAVMVRHPTQFPVALALMNWVCSRFPTEFPALAQSIALKVIPVSYVGAYPALGALYLQDDEWRDLSGEIEAAIDSILLNNNVSQVLLYLQDNTTDWCQAWQAMDRKNKGAG